MLDSSLGMNHAEASSRGGNGLGLSVAQCIHAASHLQRTG